MRVFLSTPSARRATVEAGVCFLCPQRFLSTPSARRATGFPHKNYHGHRNFYPRPPRGGRQYQPYIRAARAAFLSTPSARRATLPRFWTHVIEYDFYPRPPRGGRLLSSFTSSGEKVISIHALREEGDGRKGGRPRKAKDFYPRPPRGGRQGLIYDMMDTTAFLSTPSARRATVGPLQFPDGAQHFYPRPPRGGRPGVHSPGSADRTISIHALREEGDVHLLFASQSFFDISIHALREEGDGRGPAEPCRPGYFYPRPPRGGRRIDVADGLAHLRFLSTPSARRATAKTEKNISAFVSL